MNELEEVLTNYRAWVDRLHRKVAAAKAQGAADERAAILGLLADEATVEAIQDWQEAHTEGHTYDHLIAGVLAAVRGLLAERGAP